MEGRESSLIHLFILAYGTLVICVGVVVGIADSNVCTSAAPFGHQARFVLEMMAEICLGLLLMGAFYDACSETCRRSVFFRVCALLTPVLMFWAVLASARVC